jgi:hypothetical protein
MRSLAYSKMNFREYVAEMELFLELDSKILILLTDNQLKLFDEMKSEHRGNHFHHHRKQQR